MNEEEDDELTDQEGFTREEQSKTEQEMGRMYSMTEFCQ